MIKKNVEVIFSLLRGLENDSIKHKKHKYDEIFNLLFRFLNDKAFLVLCYEHLDSLEEENSKEEDLIWS